MIHADFVRMKNSHSLNSEVLERIVANWNEKFPVGTPVRYWSVLPFGPISDHVTKSQAWLNDAGTPVVILTSPPSQRS